jgi:hypothetical protein
MVSDAQDETDESAVLTELENQAHSQRVLLSSDAMRYFVGKVQHPESRRTALDTVLAKARVSFPSEDGWVVINLARMEHLLETVETQEDIPVAQEDVPLEAETATPIQGGSLAEAILSGNLLASYEMISHRPMVALADAVSDLDTLFRFKKGEHVLLSEMLKKEGARLSEEELQGMINALTSALDGTYTDEASAVKMAILKAVKVRG